MNCKFCDAPLPVGSSPRRLFCDDAHKMKWHRQQHQEDQHAALLAELEQLRHQVNALQQENAEQVQVISRLYEKLNYESRYLAEYDSVKRNFKSYLTKQPSTPFIQKLLADSFISQSLKETRKHYEYLLHRRLHCTQEEMEEFTRLWKLMILQS